MAEGDRLLLKQGLSSAATLVKHSEARYALEGRGAAEIVMVAGPNGQTEYVHNGSRSFARVGM